MKYSSFLLSRFTETVSYCLLMGSALGVVFYFFHDDPVNYIIFLISEDQWGEYFTSTSYALASVLLFILLFKPAQRHQKVLWVMIGVAAFLIGAEEISWGQRIFDVSTMPILNEVNVQGELNFHNIKSVHHFSYHAFVAYIFLFWSFFSIAVSLWFPRLKNKVETLGLPLIPIRLVIVFLTVPYFFLFDPVVKSDEIGELFLSIATVVWASDQFLQYGRIKQIRGLGAVIFILSILFISSVLSAGMTYRYPGDLSWRLNMAATRDYPGCRMYNQAESIYEYIYSHPEHLESETRLNHARMLLELNNQNKAHDCLLEAVSEFEKHNPIKKELSKHLRTFGTVLVLLEQPDHADAKFELAIEVDEQEIALTSDQETKSKLLWSIAKTLAAKRDISGAIDKAQQAKSISTLASGHIKIDHWIMDLKEKNSHHFVWQ